MSTDSTNGEAGEWRPRFPITSVFASIMLLWAALLFSRLLDLLVFGIPAIAVIPRVRRRIVRWVRNEYDRDLTARRSVIGIGLGYAILVIMAAGLMLGEAGTDPTLSGPGEQLTVGFGSIVIAYVVAVVIVTAIRINRKLRG